MRYVFFHRLRSIVIDIVLAALVFLFLTLGVLSPTLGNEDFYNRYLSNTKVTALLKAELDKNILDYAEDEKLDSNAFSYAVSEDEIASVQNKIIRSAFSGNNYDYSESSGIKEKYYTGISEYYDLNSLAITQEQLDSASEKATQIFNRVMGIGNTTDFKGFVELLSRGSIVFAVISLVLTALMIYRIYFISHGRTKIYSHYGCALSSAGLAMVAMFLANWKFGIMTNIYFTDNRAVNLVISNAMTYYFLICAVFGVVMFIAGESMILHVYRYYTRKRIMQKQEREINSKLKYEEPEKVVSTIGNISGTKNHSTEQE